MSFPFGTQGVGGFFHKHDLHMMRRGQEVVEDIGKFCKESVDHPIPAANYCGEFDNGGAALCVDKTRMCPFPILKTAEWERALCLKTL